MNVLAGLIIGVLSDNWSTSIQYSFIWAIIHVIYGAIFGLHKNIITESTKAGNPILSYFVARFFTAIVTTGLFSAITFFIINFFKY